MGRRDRRRLVLRRAKLPVHWRAEVLTQELPGRGPLRLGRPLQGLGGLEVAARLGWLRDVVDCSEGGRSGGRRDDCDGHPRRSVGQIPVKGDELPADIRCAAGRAAGHTAAVRLADAFRGCAARGGKEVVGSDAGRRQAHALWLLPAGAEGRCAPRGAGVHGQAGRATEVPVLGPTQRLVHPGSDGGLHQDCGAAVRQSCMTWHGGLPPRAFIGPRGS
mmetsp:Transcript_110961/g.320700  ORF Transcript_110961/g.320700 Transcript_110961/m.320700 type:complete len:218 (-) Transcript_110961:47-700(-)